MPSVLVVKKLLKMRSIFSGAMPVPESLYRNNYFLLFTILGIYAQNSIATGHRTHRFDSVRNEVEHHLLQLHPIDR